MFARKSRYPVNYLFGIVELEAMPLPPHGHALEKWNDGVIHPAPKAGVNLEEFL
jgi:hypothetical protein